MLKIKIATLLVLMAGTMVTAIADGDRAERWEYSFSIDHASKKSLEFANGDNIDLDPKLIWGLGFGYNINNYLSADFLFSYSKSSYDATYEGKPYTSTTDMHSTYTMMGMTYNIIDAPFTPFVSAKVGMAFVNSGISDDSPPDCDQTLIYSSCYESTHTTTELSYSAMVGLRYDFKSQVFVKGGVGINVVNYDSINTPYFNVYQLMLGMRY